jgi:hypothetical protein
MIGCAYGLIPGNQIIEAQGADNTSWVDMAIEVLMPLAMFTFAYQVQTSRTPPITCATHVNASLLWRGNALTPCLMREAKLLRRKGKRGENQSSAAPYKSMAFFKKSLALCKVYVGQHDLLPKAQCTCIILQ